MNKHLLSIITAAVSMTAVSMTMSTDAHAEEFSLHLETGAAVPIFKTQPDIYKVGLSGSAEGLFIVGHNLAIGPMVSALQLNPREGQSYRRSDATMWQFNGAVRIQSNRASSNSWISPYIQGSGGLGYIARLAVPTADLTVGADVALNEHHEAWLGLYARYSHAWRMNSGSSDSLITHNDDANIFTVGASVSFDFPPRPRIVTTTKYVPQYINVPVVVTVHDQVQAPKPTPAPVHARYTGKVYFSVDSSTLDWRATDSLDYLLPTLKVLPTISISVVGNTSQDHVKLTASQIKHDADLAHNRGQAVANYLESHGIDFSRITVDATSDSGKNDTVEARERNRNSTLTVEVYSK